MEGITHPFETKVVNAKSIASEKEVPGYGKVIHLEYQDLPFSTAYDLLKIVDKNTILGKAFFGRFGKGREMFSFSMSRVYDIHFLTEDDLLTIFNNDKLSYKPNKKELVGKWEGMLVSDSAISPRSQIFTFTYEDGELDMKYKFANMLSGRSDISFIEENILRLDDQTPFHDEIRMVTPDFAVGVWMSGWSSETILKPVLYDLHRYFSISTSYNTFLNRLHIPRIRLPEELGLSFIKVEKNKEGQTRWGLLFILKRISL